MKFIFHLKERLTGIYYTLSIKNKISLVFIVVFSSLLILLAAIVYNVTSGILINKAFTVTIGVGKVHNGISEICSSYKEAQIAIKNKLILGNDRIITFNSLEPNQGVVSGDINFRNNMLINLRLANTSEVMAELNGIFSSIVEKGLLIENLYMVLSKLLLTIKILQKRMKLICLS